MKCQHLLLGCDPQLRDQAPLEIDVNRLFEEICTVVQQPDGSALQLAAERFVQSHPGAHGVWNGVTIAFDGDSLRNDAQRERADGTASLITHLRSRNSDTVYISGINQVRLQPAPSQVRLLGFADVRYTPDLRSVRNQLRIEEKRPGRACLVRGMSTLEFDPKTAFIYRVQSPSLHVAQDLPTLFSGVVLPRVSGRARYRDARLVMADILIVESAEWNVPPPKAFEVAVPTGTVIHNEVGQLRSFRATEPISDVATARPAASPPRAEELGPKSSSLRLLVINCVALCCLGMWFVARTRCKEK